jgi:hypothetical protein
MKKTYKLSEEQRDLLKRLSNLHNKYVNENIIEKKASLLDHIDDILIPILEFTSIAGLVTYRTIINSINDESINEKTLEYIKNMISGYINSRISILLDNNIESNKNFQ